MFGLGMQELLIILVIVLIIFSAGKLPQMGSALGKSIHHFKRSVSENNDSSGKPTEISAEKK